jgi:hypothetical protein
MDSTMLAEEISRDWQHIRAVLTVALGDEWAEQIHDADGAFTVIEGRLLACFDGVYYSTNRADGSVLVIRDEHGCSVGYTYAVDGRLLARHAVAGPTTPDMN